MSGSCCSSPSASAPIGFVDDYLKLTGATAKGLPGRAKLLGAVRSSAWSPAVLAIIRLTPAPLRHMRRRPFFKDAAADLGWFFCRSPLLVMVGASNAVNLTDGLDGLAIVPVMIAAGCFALIAYLVGNIGLRRLPADSTTSPAPASSRCSAARWSAPASASSGSTRRRPWCSWATPARSSIGGALGAISVVTKHELVLAIIGGLFVLETVSVIVQVGSLQADRQARLPHGAAAPSFREEGLGGADHRHPLLDHRRRSWRWSASRR